MKWLARPSNRQRGVTLIEALVALLIMAFGMVAMVGIESNLRRSADVARQRSEAVRLGQQEIEQLRAFGTLTLPPNAEAPSRAYEQITDGETSNAGDRSSNTQFHLTRSVVSNAGDTELQVTVTWADRAASGAEPNNSIRLSTIVGRVDPKLAASLSIPPNGQPTLQPLARSPDIPLTAKDLGNGQSIFKPPALSSGIAWVLDNRTGAITKRCIGLAPSATNAELTLSDVTTYCTNDVNALLLSGFVRFSTGDVPDPELPLSPALPLNVGLVGFTTSDTPPVTVTQPSHECFDDAPAAADATQTAGVRFYCAVYPLVDRTPPSWDARLNLLDLPLGTGGYKVCRYSADYDGDQAMSNREHPLNYLLVSTALTRQNFLVVRADRNCPAGHRVDPAQGHFFDSATIEHQPDPH